MGDWLTPDFFSIVVAGFLVGIVVGLTGMGGGALMTPALIFLGVGDASAVVTADLTAAAIYKTRRRRDPRPPGLTELDPRQVADHRVRAVRPARALAGPRRRRGRPGDRRTAAQGVHRLRAAVRGRDVRPAPLHQPAPGRAAASPRRPGPARSGRWSRVAVGALGGLLVGITSVGVGLGDHDRAADALPRTLAVRLVGTDLVQAVPLVLARRDLEHRHQRARLAHPRPAGARLHSGHRPRRPDRAAGPAVVHPARHRGGADDVRAWRCWTSPAGRRSAPARTTTHPVLVGLVGPRDDRARPAGLGPASGVPKGCPCSARRPSPSSRARSALATRRSDVRSAPTTSPRCRRAGTPHTPHTPNR